MRNVPKTSIHTKDANYAKARACACGVSVPRRMCPRPPIFLHRCAAPLSPRSPSVRYAHRWTGVRPAGAPAFPGIATDSDSHHPGASRFGSVGVKFPGRPTTISGAVQSILPSFLPSFDQLTHARCDADASASSALTQKRRARPSPSLPPASSSVGLSFSRCGVFCFSRNRSEEEEGSHE